MKAPVQRTVSDISAVTYHSLHSSSLFPGESATIESVRTVHCLEAELVKLRESTKDALQQAWEEVEILQQQCASHLEMTTQLEADFMKTKKKEHYWHKRCLEAEKQYMQSNGPENSPQTSRSNLSVEVGSFIGWPSIRGFARGIHRETSADTVDGTLGEMSKSSLMTTSSNSWQNDGAIADLKMKVTSRESAVESLERTVAQHVKAMHTMQSEMQCMMETQRIKEKNAQANYLRKENVIGKQMTSLHKDLEKRLKIIGSQKTRIREYKVYIKEVTRELRIALDILQGVESRGFTLVEPKSRQKKKVK